MKNKNVKPGKGKYSLLNELGSKLNLSFSSHLVLGRKIIALDGIKKKLLVSAIENGFKDSFVIDLANAKSISVNKRYSGIKAGELLKNKFEKFLESIYLKFDFGSDETRRLSFYQRERRQLPGFSSIGKKCQELANDSFKYCWFKKPGND